MNYNRAIKSLEDAKFDIKIEQFTNQEQRGRMHKGVRDLDSLIDLLKEMMGNWKDYN